MSKQMEQSKELIKNLIDNCDNEKYINCALTFIATLHDKCVIRDDAGVYLIEGKKKN